jgi:hypothetical protein
MNEEAVKTAYDLFVKDGYNKDLNSFKKLMQTNEEARGVAHDLFVQDGYNKDINSFSKLMGVGLTMEQPAAQVKPAVEATEVKKKDVVVPSSSVTPSSSSSTQSQSSSQKAHEIYTKLYTRLKNNPETADKAETLAKLMTAQASVEAGEDFNSRLARESNNYSGIKFFGQKDSTASKIKSPSSEQGGAIPYAHYNSMDEWADAYMNLMKGKYKEAFDSKSATDFAHALKKYGYFEAPEEAYRSELDRRMHLYGLMNMTPEQVSQSAKKVVSQKASPKQDSFFNTALNAVTPDLVGKEQEEVTAKLNYEFGAYGFKFNPTGGMFADDMEVVAPNGKKMPINLDTSDANEAAKLKAFIAANKPQQTAIDKIDATYRQAKTKFVSEQDMKTTMSTYQKESNDFKKSAVDFVKRRDALNNEMKEFNALTPEQKQSAQGQAIQKSLVQRNAQILKEDADLNAKQKQIEAKGKQLNASVGEYTKVLAEQGSTLGGMWNSIINSVASTEAAYVSLFTDVMSNLLPYGGVAPEEHRKIVEDAAKSKNIAVPSNMNQQQFDKWYEENKDKKDLDASVTDKIKKINKFGDKEVAGSQGLVDIARESAQYNPLRTSGTTEEYLHSPKRGFFENALFGVAGSLPAMAAPSAVRPIQFFAQGYDMLSREMENNPAFDNVSENEKSLVAIPIGIVSAVLEEAGMRGVLNKSSLVTGLTMKVLGKATKDMTAATFQELVRTEIKSGIARGLIGIGTATLSEAETGFAQQLTEDGVKAIYNKVKGDKMFQDIPTDAKGFVEKAAVAGAAEAVGGFIFGSIGVGLKSHSRMDYATMDDKQFNTFVAASKDQNIVDAFMANVDAQVSSGNLTQEEGQRTKDNYQDAINTLNSIPDNMSDESKKKALSILARRNELMKRIEGKDPNLVKDELETIKKLNGELSTMPRTKYVLNGKEMTRDEFVHEVSQLDADGLQNMNATVENDNKTTQAIGELLSIKIPEQGNVEIINGQHKTQEQNAIQEPSTTESVLRTEQPEMGLQEVGEGNAQEQATPEEVKPQEEVTVTEEGLKGLPEDVANNTSVEISDGLELPVKGNEAFISRTYDEIKAKPEGERTDLETKALGTIESLFPKVEQPTITQQTTSQESTTAEQPTTEEAALAEPQMTDEELAADEERIANELDGFDQVMREVENMRDKRRKGSYQEIVDNIKNYVQNTPLYQAANDTQREDINRHVSQKLLGEKNIAAPKAKTLLGINFKEKATFTVDLYNALKEQLKREATVAAQAAKQTAKEYKQAAKDLKAKQKEILKQIAADVSEMVKNGAISQKQAASIINRFANVNLEKDQSIQKFTQYVNDVFEKSAKSKSLSQIKDLIVNAAKGTISTSGKLKSANKLDAFGHEYFNALKSVLKEMLDGTFTDLSQSQMDAIDDILDRKMNGEPLTSSESKLLNKYLAIERLRGIENMGSEELGDLYETLIKEKEASRSDLLDAKQKNKEEIADISNKATEQIKQTDPLLFNEDGTPKNANQLRDDETAIQRSFQDGVFKAVKNYFNAIKYKESKGLLGFIRNILFHLNTLSNILDRGGRNNFFKENVYNALNKMHTTFLSGVQNTDGILDDIANSIGGITKGYNEIRSMLYSKAHDITYGNRRTSLNNEQLLWLYALSLNKTQEKKLAAMGFDKAKMEEIKTILGPELTEFADKVVGFLSEEYYDTINEVYSDLNNINLPKLENYFPTRTLSPESKGTILNSENFNQVFNAEYTSAFKQRTDTQNEVELGNSFIDLLDNHIEAMERYKAFAKGVKILNGIMNNPAVKNLLTQTHLSSLYRNSIAFAINPKAISSPFNSFVNSIIRKFSGVKLAFKLMQFPKQATSFVQAYSKYRFFDNKFINAIPLIDLPMFMFDFAKVLANVGKETEEAYAMSPDFKERLDKGLGGEVAEIVSGTKTFHSIIQRHKGLSKVTSKVKGLGAAPTVFGDLVSVLAYKAAYNRDIQNGMSKEDALQKFNDFNNTLQSRRPTDMSAIQQSNNAFTRMFIMFASTNILQINNIAESWYNITTDLANKKLPRKQDVRSFYINLIVANLMFGMIANIFKYVKGNDKDKEEVLRRLRDYGIGLNLLYSLPLFGAVIEGTMDAIQSSRKLRYTWFGSGRSKPHFIESGALNPIVDPVKQTIDAIKHDDILRAVKPAIEMGISASTDPLFALGNSFKNGKVSYNDFYDMIGVAKSYRPDNKGLKYQSKSFNREFLKSQDLSTYNDLFGKGSPSYEMLLEKKEANQ